MGAIQTVPNQAILAQDLEETLQEPPTEEEFRWAIKDHKKSTAPGMSNVTYGNVKHWQDELITHCYQLLRNMWGKEHIPQVWKEKWAVLLTKIDDTSDINNLRPIGLEDCMRKLWFSISYKRISQAWSKHGALDEAHHGFVPNRGTLIVAFWICSTSSKRHKNGAYRHSSAHGMLNEHSTVSVAQ